MQTGGMSIRPPRRTVLLLGVGGILAGCDRAPTTHPATHAAAHPAAPSSSRPPSPGASAITTLPAVTRWQPSTNDISPAAKLAAVRRIERLGNRAGRALQVIDAQYGGILAASASVLVVTRSWTTQGTRVLADGHTYDVRVHLSGHHWQVDTIRPSRPGPASAQLSTTARRVLASGRIELPPAARRDVLSGRVHGSVLNAMLTLAGSHRVGVSVVRSGHPIHVFGTNRLSDHPQGRAFDTWRIDGHAVVDPRTSKQLVTEYMHAAAAAGSYNVGGPVLLGSPPQWFSDNTHHDHVHAGFVS